MNNGSRWTRDRGGGNSTRALTLGFFCRIFGAMEEEDISKQLPGGAKILLTHSTASQLVMPHPLAMGHHLFPLCHRCVKFRWQRRIGRKEAWSSEDAGSVITMAYLWL